MPEDVKVKPTPIQRNANDVAMELLKLHIENSSKVDYSIESLQNMYLKFYSTAKFVEQISSKYLKDYMPSELRELAEKF